MIPLVVNVEDTEAGTSEQFAFIRSPVRIGRGELNDLPLQRPFVSTYHGLLQFDDQEARYLDLGSLNGSTLGGVRLEKNAPAVLGPGAELVIGTLRLTFARRSTVERLVPRQMTAFGLRASSFLQPLEEAPAPPPMTALQEPSSAPGDEPSSTAAPAVDVDVAVDAAADAAAAAALDAASLELNLQFLSYRGAWEHLRASLSAVLDGLDGSARRAAFTKLSALYPALAAEPQFRELGGLSPGATPPPEVAAPVPDRGAPESREGADAPRLLRAFVEAYLGERSLARGEDVRAVLEHVAGVLETFARSFLELRRGYEEFGSEMGIRTLRGEGAIYKVRDAPQLLAYVLDPGASGREQELQRAFADFMLHQVALLRGIVEGARALLDRVGPDTIAAQAPKGIWPMRAVALWKAFEATFHEIADEDDAVSSVLFGKEFARAYAAIAGDRAARAVGGEGEDSSESEPAQ
jgi:type VI secretion system protein ImpI